MSTLLYLHGFNSSPQSKKAIQTQQWLADHAPQLQFHCPSLPPFANQVMTLLQALIEEILPAPVYLVGSSMGGFFATCLAEQYDLRTVLINPAVNPARGLHNWLGENHNYVTGEPWTLLPQHIDEYAALNPGERLRRKNYKVLLQTGDEVLDYRDAEHRYRGCQVLTEKGGDHSFIDYQAHLPAIYRFLTDAKRENNHSQ